MGIFKIFKCFSKIWRKGTRYIAERIGDKADSWLTPMSTLKIRKRNCSRNTEFFYQQDNSRRIWQLWSPNPLYQESKWVTDDSKIGRIEKYQKPGYL